MRGLGVLVLLVALAACGGQGEDVTTSDADESRAAPASELTITVRAGPDASGETWTLTCDPPGGTHPNPEAACRALEQARRDPFAPVPSGMLCTQVYGGPETATITGTWQNRSVHASYKRTDGCEIARWKAIAAVLGPGDV